MAQSVVPGFLRFTVHSSTPYLLPWSALLRASLSAASKASHGHNLVSCQATAKARCLLQFSMWAMGWLHKRKVQTCVVIAIVGGFWFL